MDNVVEQLNDLIETCKDTTVSGTKHRGWVELKGALGGNQLKATADQC